MHKIALLPSSKHNIAYTFVYKLPVRVFGKMIKQDFHCHTDSFCRGNNCPTLHFFILLWHLFHCYCLFLFICNIIQMELSPQLRYRSATYGAFPLHGTVRFSTARYSTVRLSSGRFAFPLQFSTAIEWAGLFTRRYNCAASTAVTSS